MDITPLETLCLAGVGAAGLCISAVAFVGTQKFRRSAARADGLVIELVRSRHGSGGDLGSNYTYYPRFSFTTLDGQQLSILSDIGNSPAAFKVGDKVVVLYDPRNPSDGQIDSASQLWILPGIVGVLSLALLVFGAYLYDQVTN